MRKKILQGNIRYYDHIERYVVKIKDMYLTYCDNLKIYVIGNAHEAEKFKTKKLANDALENYKKYKT